MLALLPLRAGYTRHHSRQVGETQLEPETALQAHSKKHSKLDFFGSRKPKTTGQRRGFDLERRCDKAGGCFESLHDLKKAAMRGDDPANFDVSRVTEFGELVRRLPPPALFPASATRATHRIPPSHRPACRAAVQRWRPRWQAVRRRR